MMESRPAADGIALQSRTLSHYFVVRKVAELVQGRRELRSIRREWSVDLPRARLPRAWESLRAAVEATAAGGAWSLVLFEDRHDELNAVMTDAGGTVVRAQVASNAVCAWLYGDEAATQKLIAAIDAGLARVVKVDRSDLVPVRFWHKTSDGADENMRRIQCPRWSEIAANYPTCGAPLASLMQMDEPWQRGRLVFWHGPPGTGKTWALRALIREWSSMTPEVITDPDEFFASNSYLQYVLLADPPALTWTDEGRVRSEERPRLFIIEDAPQLVLQESRGANGTRMANLLSMTDGILGQGLRAVFVITTNEKVHRVDAAIRRPGRCLQELELARFDRAQAAAWFATRSRSLPDGAADYSLAELYDLLRGDVPRPPEPELKLGFTPHSSSTTRS